MMIAASIHDVAISNCYLGQEVSRGKLQSPLLTSQDGLPAFEAECEWPKPTKKVS